MENSEIMYERREGTDCDHGINFERNTTTLSYSRCEILHRQWKQDNTSGVRSYFVANNVDHVGAFDDVVVRAEYPDGGTYKTKMMFVQCKHFLDPNKGSLEKILNSEITKYFDSFIIVQRIINEKMVCWEKFNEIEMQMYLKKHNNLNMQRNAEREIGRKFTQRDYEMYLRNRINEDMKANKTIRDKLKDMFKCNISDCEFFLYSNKTSNTESKDGALENTINIRCNNDISSKIINNATEDIFEVQLEEKYHSKIKYEQYQHFSQKDFEYLRTEFGKRFKIYVNQVDTIKKEISLLIKPETDDEMILQLFQQEQQYIIQHRTCSVLTENSEMIDILESFYQLKYQSKKRIKIFQGIANAESLFTNQAIRSLQRNLSSECATKISTTFLQLDGLQILQFFMTKLQKEKLFVHIENAKDVVIWSKARKSKSYKNINNILVYSKMEKIFSDCNKEANEIFIEIHQISEDIASSFDDYTLKFSDETTQSILNYPVKLQGFELTVNNIFGQKWRQLMDENNILEIIKKHDIIISSYALPPLDCYVQRKLRVKTLTIKLLRNVGKCLSSLGSKIKYLVFSEDPYTNEALMGRVPTIQHFENISEARKFISEIKVDNDTNGKIHQLCSTCDGKINLIYSSGKKIDGSDFIDIKEQDFFVSEKNKLSIIIGPAGIGKSSTLLSLAHLFKSKHPSHLVYFIELNKHLKKLKGFKCENNLSNGIKFIADDILNLEKHNLEHRLFIDACENTGNVALFFDAFDEISPDGEKNLTILLDSLEKSSISRIIVSSRHNYVDSLERALTVNGITFSPFDRIDIEIYLLMFLENYTKENNSVIKDNEDVKDFVNCILKSMDENNGLLNEFLCIPLQMKMLAVLYFEKYTEMSTEKKSSFSFTTDLCSLYKDFIMNHVERYLMDKMKLNDMKERDRIIAIHDVLKDADILACEIICPDIKKISLADRTHAIVKMLDHVGLLTSIDPPVFFHRTIGEFLTAIFFVRCIKNLNETNAKYISFFCKNILLEYQYRDIRRFINAILCDLNSGENESQLANANVKILVDWEYGETSLHIAAKEKHAEIVKLLVLNDPSKLNEKNIEGKTAVEFACRSGCFKSVEILGLNNCQKIMKNEHEGSVLHFAAKGNSIDVIHMILEKFPTILRKKNRYGSTAFSVACRYNNTEAAMCLLQFDRGLADIADEEGNLPIHYAIEKGNIQIVKEILCHNNNLIDSKCKDGLSPLHIACKYNHIEIAKYLLAQKNNLVNVECGEKKETPLHFAAKYGNIEQMKLLLHYDPALLNKCNSIGESPLLCALLEKQNAAAKFLLKLTNCVVKIGENLLTFAARNNDIELMMLLLDRDQTLINKCNLNGESPLVCALLTQQTAVAKFLLTYPNCLVTSGENPLTFAARNGDIELMMLLLDRDQSLLSKCNSDGESPLVCALLTQQTAVAKFLLTYSNCLVNTGENPLALAAIFGDVDLLRKIYSLDCTLLNKVGENSSRGHTPLLCALKSSNFEAATYLLELPDCLLTVDLDGKSPFHYAAMNGYIEILTLLINKDRLLLLKRDKIGRSALYFAINQGQTEVVRTLLSCDEYFVEGNILQNELESGIKTKNFEIMTMMLKRDSTLINMENIQELLPLDIACECNNIEAVKYLLPRTDSALILDRKLNQFILHLAAVNGNLNMMQLILEKFPTLLNQRDFCGRTALHYACKSNNTEMAKILLNHDKCQIDVYDDELQNPLHLASQHCNIEVMKLILENDIKLLNKQNKFGQSPLHLILNQHQSDSFVSDAAEYLLNLNCLVNKELVDGINPIHLASKKNEIKIIKLIIERDEALLNLQDGRGLSPLHHACKCRSNETVSFLLNLPECDINLTDNEGNTPLHHAAMDMHENNSVTIMSLLIQRDRSLLNKRNKMDQTALHLAATHSNANALEYLLGHMECKANVQDKYGDTPLHSFIKGNNDFFFTDFFRGTSKEKKILLFAKLDSSLLNIKNNYGQTPLHIAVEKNESCFVDFLVRSKADVHMKDNDSLTPLDLALKIRTTSVKSLDQSIIEILQNN